MFHERSPISSRDTIFSAAPYSDGDWSAPPPPPPQYKAYRFDKFASLS
jgi:hypothetical protein